MNYSSGNSNGQMLIRSIVIVILISMFMSGVFLVTEGIANNPASEANKKWIGAGHIIAASLFAIMYIISLRRLNL